MAGAVSRLRVRAPSGAAGLARLRTEEALRLADPGDRLLIARRLDLGRIGVGSPAALWNVRAAERIALLRHRAVHAATPGAGAAEAVWFRSAEEAELLLLRELAAGRMPSAWFWRLAVRGWRGAPLVRWLPQWIAEGAGDPRHEVALAHAFMAVAAAGHLPILVAALTSAPPPPSPPVGAVADVSVPAAHDASHAREPVEGMTARMHRLLMRHDPAVRTAVLAAIAAAPADSVARWWVARLSLLASAPELAAQPALLAGTTATLLAFASARGTATGMETVPVGSAPDRAHDATSADRGSDERRPSIGTELAGPPPAERPCSPPSALVPAADLRPALPAEVAVPVNFPRAPSDELESMGAGIFLLVRPLILMGLPDWLERRPALAAEGFGRALLQAIAARMRIPENDPAFAVLNLEPCGAWAAPLLAWRIGLDRWLRRTARVRLADVVRRRGWISAEAETVSVRFRLGAADVRLRRRALDIDPGWVPWLGLVVRYHYRDEPMPPGGP